MSCPDGSCKEPGKRQRALIAFGLMMIIFIVLSGFSFLNSRGQVVPGDISFGSHMADEGKHVFQAYNCMGCHTMVGNGAYLAPDLTKEYKAAGPAWLAAFLPSAGTWPTEAAIKVQLLNNDDIAEDAGVDNIEDYYKKYPGAKERVQRRVGTTLMPNLPLTSEEVGQLIAYLKYTSAMNTEGWPPETKIPDLNKRLSLAHPVASAAAAGANQAQAAEPVDPIELGHQLATDNGCFACHATDNKKMTGPSWGKLYSSQVKLTTGSTVAADDAYLTESILQPNAKIVDGYQAGLMPAYDKLLSKDEVKAIVEYIHSLE